MLWNIKVYSHYQNVHHIIYHIWSWFNSVIFATNLCVSTVYLNFIILMMS